MIKNSYIYDGNVIHKRFKPKVHFFKYKVFSLLIDLSELELLDKSLKIFSYNKFNIMSFYNRDHGARNDSSIRGWVIDNLKIYVCCSPNVFFTSYITDIKFELLS
jgi:DUF1365 family protein